MTENQSPNAAGSALRCHICGEAAVEPLPGYEKFHRVTSDCKPWSTAGKLCICHACGTVQSLTDRAWQDEVTRIYQAYSIYHQSEGSEQAVFDQTHGIAASRSERILGHLSAGVPLVTKGRLLDVGCGNGALLQSFHRLMPQWSLAGTELDSRYASQVESIGNVEAFYTCDPEHVPGAFDLVTMVHVLEHIISPRHWLDILWKKLKIGRLILIEVPDHLQNPFELLIADHCTHFSIETLTNLIESAGYRIVVAAADWVPKELTVVAKKTTKLPVTRKLKAKALLDSTVVKGLRWLEAVVAVARECSARGKFGLFGTSIAGTWLFGELGERVSFFVDEDPQRVGKTYLDRPIYHPNHVPDGSHVFLALPTILAESVQGRVARPGVTYHLPPSNEYSNFSGS